ncbi:MAG: hypothetical protein JNJ90_03655 [Saprospiraceae bacterium]|jgi:hypothetical protein|nr:hypothetical protein [Saprospiraceae bacterium]
MKNPIQPSGDKAGAVFTGGIQLVQQEPDDCPFVTPTDINPQEMPTPQEESFRALLREHLPRHTAPQALRERIKRSIMQLPD